MGSRRRFLLATCLIILLSFFLFSWTFDTQISDVISVSHKPFSHPIPDPKVIDDAEYFWRKLPARYPVESIRPLPTQKPLALPKVQANFDKESPESRRLRLKRQTAVRNTFERCWVSYKKIALPHDEMTPITGHSKDNFGGWGATLVDSLDTLWIMGLSEELEEAIDAATRISFEASSLKEVK